MKRKYIFLTSCFIFFFLSANAFSENAVEKLKDPKTPRSEYSKILNEIIDDKTNSQPQLIQLLETSQQKATKATSTKAPQDKQAADDSWKATVTAMDVLGEWQAEESLDTLKEMLYNSQKPSAIYNSARTIGQIGGNYSYEILSYLLENMDNFPDRQEERKRAAIIGLGFCGKTDAISLLKKELDDAQNSVVNRIYAAHALGMLGNVDGLNFAINYLNSDDSKERDSAIKALGAIGLLDSLPLLYQILQSNDAPIFVESATTSSIQIETKKFKNVQDRIDFIKQKMMEHPNDMGLVNWGTKEIKSTKSSHGKKVLEELSVLPDQKFNYLKYKAKLKLTSNN